MADFLTEKRQEIDNRLKELRPLYEEYQTLEKAQAALAGMEQPRRRGPGRPPGSTSSRARSSSGNGRRRRRRRSGGTRGEQALTVVRQNPGITVSELGDKLGVTQKNYLYRVMANLQEDGAVRKEGKGFHAS
jgi:predicted HTH transcriptional regulator